MRRASIITVIVLAMIMATASVAIAKSSKHGVEKQRIIQIFDSETGDPVDSPRSFGQVKLTRSDDGVDASVQVHGLEPGGVYTFWWVIGEAGFALPDAFVANGGGEVIGSNGKAKLAMSADVGDPTISGFGDSLGLGLPLLTDPFHPTFDLDPMTAEAHVEIAYHGQAPAGGVPDAWLTDFWTGDACPAVGVQSGTQPHCPVSYVAVFPGS